MKPLGIKPLPWPPTEEQLKQGGRVKIHHEDGGKSDIGRELAFDVYREMWAAEPEVETPDEATDAMAMAIRHYDLFSMLSDDALRMVAKAIYKDMRAAQSPADTAPVDTHDVPKTGSLWEHYNKRTQYRIIGLANEHSEHLDKYPVSVVYQGVHNGYVWVRSLKDWHRSMSLVTAQGDAAGQQAGGIKTWQQQMDDDPLLTELGALHRENYQIRAALAQRPASAAPEECCGSAEYCTRQRCPDSAAPEVDEADLECQIPPFGWRCTRGAGHEGPCAAVECPEDVDAVRMGMERLSTAADSGRDAAQAEPNYRTMTSAPRDGTMLRLLVAFTDNATEDTPGACPTIGANNFDHDGINEWKFAGWNWSHDCFAEGHGKPIGWLPMHDATPAPKQAEARGYAVNHRLEALVLEYGNTPVVGPRRRADVMMEIYELLYRVAPPQPAAEVRKQALEEAAEICETEYRTDNGWGITSGDARCAAAIRALATKGSA